MVIHLSAVEPGANWLNPVYQFDRNSKPISGWVLTVNWYHEDGLPQKGIVSFVYYCGLGIYLNKCSAVVRHRQSLIPLTIHSPVLYKVDDSEVTPIIPGMESCTLEIANGLLQMCGAEITWNYNPPKK
jgi:hypothetical protein